MSISLHFPAEIIRLKNRLGRLITLQVGCLFHNCRYSVILIEAPDSPPRQLGKNAESIAHQVVERLNVDPSTIDFFQLSPGGNPDWLRWRFRWVGKSPMHMQSYKVSESSRRTLLEPALEMGRPVSLMTRQSNKPEFGESLLA